MLVSAHKPAYGCIARGEQKSGAWRLGQQWFNVGLAPYVIHHDERCLLGYGGAVLVLAGQGIVVAAEVIAQGLGHLVHLRDKVALHVLASGDLDDAVGASPLHNFVVGESLGQHCLADTAHSGKRCEGDGLAVVLGEECVTQRA